jgi:hypothetical protein
VSRNAYVRCKENPHSCWKVWGSEDLESYTCFLRGHSGRWKKLFSKQTLQTAYFFVFLLLLQLTLDYLGRLLSLSLLNLDPLETALSKFKANSLLFCHGSVSTFLCKHPLKARISSAADGHVKTWKKVVILLVKHARNIAAIQNGSLNHRVSPVGTLSSFSQEPGAFLILTRQHLEYRLSRLYFMNNGHPFRHRHYAISILLLSVQALYSTSRHYLTVVRTFVSYTSSE